MNDSAHPSMGSHHRGARPLAPYLRIGAALCLILIALLSATAWALYEAQLGFGRAATLLNQGKYLESLAGYQEVATFASSPEDKARALFFMGAVYGLYLDQYEGAVRYFDRVMASYPDTVPAAESLFNKGMVLYEKGDFTEAKRAFAEYQEMYPKGKRILTAQVWEQSAAARVNDTGKTQLSQSESVGDASLRVLIRTGDHKLAVSADPGFQCTDPFSGEVLFSGRQGEFTISQERLWVGGLDLGKNRCELISLGKTLDVRKTRYRGILILQVGSSGIEVINRVGVETYLYGVVPHEMPPEWPMEALKAQAVAARSYALYIKEKRKDEPFDLMADTSSQVYGGYDERHRAAIRAVDATRGQVLAHNGRIAIAYYHANSGGYTEDAGNVWVADLPYLHGAPDPYSRKVPGTNWECSLSIQEIQDALVRAGMDVGAVREVQGVGASASGRVRTMRITSDTGTFSLKSNNFRIMMGADRIRSTRFTFQAKGGVYTFRGSGYGHGVGMSQWGARTMALNGSGYKDILNQYYQGVEFETVDYALHAKR